MMIFAIMLSYVCYISAIDKKSLFCFYFSAFVFGYALEIRETALLSFFFFPVFFVMDKN